MRRWAAALLVLTAGAGSSFALGEDYSRVRGLQQLLEEQRATVLLRTNYFRSSRELNEETDFLGATAQIKALPAFTDHIDGKVEVRAIDSDLTQGGGGEVRVLEAYAAIHFERVDVRIGKQIVAWGRADGINPTDNLTPRDFVTLLPFEEDQRFGTPGIRVDTVLSQEHTLTVFASPWFEPSIIPLPRDSRIVTGRPARTLNNTAFGLKLDKVGGALDWSVSYFHGRRLLPNLRIAGSDVLGPLLQLHYAEVDVLGADITRNYGRFGLRGEVAATENSLFWVAGVDRTFFEDMNVNLQFIQRRLHNYRDPEQIADVLERRVAIQNSIINGQQASVSNAVSFRISNKWFNDTLEAEVLALINLSRNDRFARPFVSYAFNDRLKGIIGAEIYLGAVDTPFGSHKSNRGVFVEMRYGF
jgi:hypothetical protein